MQEQNVKKEKIHTLTIDQKKTVKATGIESVVAFSSSRIALNLSDGGRLCVNGTDLKITAFSKDLGDFEAVGTVTGATYSGKFGAKLFK
ncbi:MAG: hypothetical protein IKA72_01640 [Clostridia bacterium]|nr:hypothetical protein [Clostridia bacterium]